MALVERLPQRPLGPQLRTELRLQLLLVTSRRFHLFGQRRDGDVTNVGRQLKHVRHLQHVT